MKIGTAYWPIRCPAGQYSGAGSNSITVDNAGGRNGTYGPGFFKLDLRLGYTLDVAQRRIELFGEIFNVTNRSNLANPSGDRSNANFLRLTALSTSTNPRLVQFCARYSFLLSFRRGSGRESFTT